MEERLNTKQRSATVSSGSGTKASRTMGNDRQPTHNVNTARQVPKQQQPQPPRGAGTGSARPAANTAASIRGVQRPPQQKVEESSEEDEDDEDDEEEEDTEEEEEDDEDEDEDDSDTEDSGSVEQRK